jgi:hypothetical protein
MKWCGYDDNDGVGKKLGIGVIGEKNNAQF